jgi:oligopeptide transport system substrate-binding protein
VRLDLAYIRNDAPTVDPQTSVDDAGRDLIVNLFAGLTQYNHQLNVVEPALAESWDISADGRTWTFYLRDDIFWMRPPGFSDNNAAATPVRPVTANDFVFTIERICSRQVDTPDAFILFLIAGCENVYQLVNATEVDIANIGAEALNERTLQITLIKPAAHFLAITSMWFLRPLPQELIAEYGNNWWTQMAPEEALFSGPFLPTSEELTTLVRNPYWPTDLRTGNVDLVNIRYLTDEKLARELWEVRAFDIVPLRGRDLETSTITAQNNARFVSEQTLFYLGFNFESGVFREPEVRRAFSAAIDREALAEEVYGRDAFPVRHLIPAEVIGGLPVDEVGMGYNPDYARQQMAASGFSSCRLMPPITFMVSSSDLSLLQAEIMRRMWVDELNCQEEQIVIEQVQFGTLLANTRNDAGNARPDMWELGWASYYPDAQNWMGDLVHCADSENRQKRPCGQVDDLIRQAVAVQDLTRRRELYREIENELFGEQGIFPIAPLYIRGDYLLVHTWVDFTPATFGGEQFARFQVDMERKLLELSR